MWDFPLISYLCVLSTINASSRYSINVEIVFADIDKCFTLLNTFSNLVGLVNDPIDYAKILINSLNSSVLCILYLFIMSLIYISSKRLVK